MENALKPDIVKVLLEKSEILRSMIEEATEGNVEPSPRFLEAHQVSDADVKNHVGDIPRLEREVRELSETVRKMSEQRSAERTTMMHDVKTLFGVPLQEITDDQLHELSDQDCKKTLPLLVKLSQNLYMDFTLNYKKAALMSVDVRFAHGLRDGYRMWLSVMQTPPGYQGSAVRGPDLVALLDSKTKQRNVGLLLEKIPIMRAAIEHPLEDLPNVEARIPFYTASEEVFGGPFQLADEARINSVPLHECKPTLQLFAKFTQNLHEELAFMTTEKTLYENAFRDLLDKLEPQETGAKANADDDHRQKYSEL